MAAHLEWADSRTRGSTDRRICAVNCRNDCASRSTAVAVAVEHLLGSLEVAIATLAVDLLKLDLENAGIVVLEELAVQLKSCACILDGVVRLQLDVLLENTPRQKRQTELAQARLEEEQIDSVNNLRFWHLDVDHSEILLQAVAQKLAAQIQKHPQLLVHQLEWYQRVL